MDTLWTHHSPAPHSSVIGKIEVKCAMGTQQHSPPLSSAALSHQLPADCVTCGRTIDILLPGQQVLVLEQIEDMIEMGGEGELI